MRPPIRRILVLCEGNHCRSPIAECLLQAALGPEFQVSSAGLGALVGHPPHPESAKLMTELGHDIGQHRGRQLTTELALSADLILVMDQQQIRDCERRIPSAKGRVFLAAHWLGAGEREIPDPIQGDSHVHRKILEHIQRALAGWIQHLAPRNP